MNLSSLFALLNTKFAGKKTYFASIATILGALAAYFAGDSTLFEALQIGIPALLAMTLRNGITTAVNNAVAAAPTDTVAK